MNVCYLRLSQVWNAYSKTVSTFFTSVDSRLAAYGMFYMFVFVSKYILKTLHEMK